MEIEMATLHLPLDAKNEATGASEVIPVGTELTNESLRMTFDHPDGRRMSATVGHFEMATKPRERITTAPAQSPF